MTSYFALFKSSKLFAMNNTEIELRALSSVTSPFHLQLCFCSTKVSRLQVEDEKGRKKFDSSRKAKTIFTALAVQCIVKPNCCCLLVPIKLDFISNNFLEGQ